MALRQPSNVAGVNLERKGEEVVKWGSRNSRNQSSVKSAVQSAGQVLNCELRTYDRCELRPECEMRTYFELRRACQIVCV